MYFTAIAIALALVSPSVATGINCNGSGLCNLGGDVASSLVNAINGIDPNRWYNNGEQIACIVGGRGQAGVCAFLQNSGGAPGHSIKTLAPYIPGHGCRSCGSVPLFYPQGDNDVSHGQLTFNGVSNPCKRSTTGTLC